MKKVSFYQDGFSLVELAIVLTIIGLIAGFSVPMLSESLHHKKWQKGERHLEEVMTALAAYVARHQRLPCAADPSAQEADRGLARSRCSSDRFSIGIVPYRTLGLPEIVVEDGYKRPFTYCVDSRFTENSSLEDFCKVLEKRLSIFGKQQEQELNRDPNNPVVFVLVGYGEKGEGAYTREGGVCPSSLSASLSVQTQKNQRPFMTFLTREERMPFFVSK